MAFGGVPAKAIIKVFSEADIYVSPELLQEYRDTPIKLQEQGKISHAQLKALIAGIAAVVSNARIVSSSEKLSLSRDPEDNMLLECCVAAKADFLLTGDKDLLEIRNLPYDFKIIKPHAFLKT